MTARDLGSVEEESVVAGTLNGMLDHAVNISAQRVLRQVPEVVATTLGSVVPRQTRSIGPLDVGSRLHPEPRLRSRPEGEISPS